MSLDPQRPDALVALYLVRVAEGATATELEALLVEALGHAPEHATLNAFYGQFLQNTGRTAEAEPYLRRGMAGDPLSSAKPLVLALNLDSIEQHSESEKVLRDARNGVVSVEKARALYGVAIDPVAWIVDEAETARLRS